MNTFQKYFVTFYSVALLLIFGMTGGMTGCNGHLGSVAQGKKVVPAAEEKAPSVVNVPVSFHENYSEALEASVREAKPMLVFFTLPNCASSKRMLETTFCDEEIKRLSSRFICVQVDGSRAGTLCQSRNITGFPTILFLNSREQEIQRLSGNQSPDQLALQMHVMIQSTASKVGAVIRK